jgi:predicted dehydrogenase
MTINWGVIGTGYMANIFIQTVSDLERHSIESVYSREFLKSDQLSNKLKIKKSSNDIEIFLKNPAIDAVYIATPLTTHFDYARLSLLNNKSILCEKPLFSDYSNYIEIKKIATENNLFVMEGIWPLYIPLIKFIKNKITEGKIGKPLLYYSEMNRKYDLSIKNRIIDKDLGGGAFNEMSVYGVALSQFFFSKPEKFSVMSKKIAFGVDLESVVHLSYKGELKTEIKCSFVSSDPTYSKIVGDKGIIEWGDYMKGENFVKIINTNNNEVEIHYFENMRLESMLNFFDTEFNNAKNSSRLYSYDNSILIGEIMCDIRKKINKSVSSYEKESP